VTLTPERPPTTTVPSRAGVIVSYDRALGWGWIAVDWNGRQILAQFLAKNCATTPRSGARIRRRP
jgi:hypothetical protein